MSAQLAVRSSESYKPMALLDVSKQFLVDEAVKALREAILKGRFQPGERLLQTRLAEMLGISR